MSSAIKHCLFLLKAASGFLALYVLLWSTILSATSAYYIYSVRVSVDRPYASRMVLPDWVFETYWRLLGEQRLRKAAKYDSEFVRKALGTWYMADTDKAIDGERENQYLAYYFCIRSSSPEGARELTKMVASKGKLTKPKLLLEACTSSSH